MNVLKIDVDVQMDKEMLELFIKTRKVILDFLGYKLIKINYKKTNKGYHFWFIINDDVTPREKWILQFLLGDDHDRVMYNQIRLFVDAFDDFNALFVRKYKLR